MPTIFGGKGNSVVAPASFRAGMSRLGASANIVTTDGEAGRYGIVVSAACSVSDAPPTLLVCINRASVANNTAKHNGVLCVNVLASRHTELCNRFAKRGLSIDERFSDAGAWTHLLTGSPALRDASVAFDCCIASISEVGSHSVFFCEVRAILMSDQPECLVYFDRRFHAFGQMDGHVLHPLNNGVGQSIADDPSGRSGR
jgi:flavin reductase